MLSIILINPPLCKPGEPPAGLAFLAGALRDEAVCYQTYDLNLEGLFWLLEGVKTGENAPKWDRRAVANRKRNIALLQEKSTYENLDRYKRAVMDVNHLLSMKGRERGLHLSLSDFQHKNFSPLNSEDIYQAADNFEENIFFPFFADRLTEILDPKKEYLVGFSLNYLSQVLCCFAMIGYLKKRFPKVSIVIGGGLATTWLHHRNWPKAGEKLRTLATFVGGRGEQTLLKLAATFETSPFHLPDFASFYGPYLAPGMILPYATSWGCFWKKCRFCPETAENNPYQHTPDEITLSHLQTLCKQEKPTLIHLLDNAISPVTLKSLAETPLPAPWYGFVRFESPLDDPFFCKKLKDSGCIMLKLGLESADPAVLNEMNKGIKIDMVNRILANLRAAGIATYVYLLFGTPGEDYNSARKTMEFVISHKEEISFLNTAIFNLPRNSAEIIETGLQVTDYNRDDLSLYQDFHHPKGWNRKEIRRFLQQEFRKESVISQILQRDPPFFTSNHAAFFGRY